MKILLTLLTLLVVVDLSGATFGQTAFQNQTSKPTQPSAPLFSLTISLPENVAKASSFIDLKVIKKNISSQDLGVYRIVGNAAASYEIAVTDVDSKPVSENSIGRKLHGKEPRGHGSPFNSAMITVLKPGESLEEHIYLNVVYDLKGPADYTIQVSQTIADDEAGLTKSVIKSNSVTLTITN